MDESIINFAAYEDSVEYLGMANATMPSLNALVQAISGAGIDCSTNALLANSFAHSRRGISQRILQHDMAFRKSHYSFVKVISVCRKV